MAGRGRPKKRGNTRMDVAVDSMSEMGFSATIVLEAVKRLLEVYGGDDYWVFIERDSYKVLIDFIHDNHNDDGGGGTTIQQTIQSDAENGNGATETCTAECQRRRPSQSHGWTCDDDTDTEDLLRLSPEPLSTALPKLFKRSALKTNFV